MNFFNNLKVSKKIAVLMTPVILLVAFVSIYALTEISNLAFLVTSTLDKESSSTLLGEIENSTKSAFSIIISLTLVTLVVGLFVSKKITENITIPLQEAEKAAKSIADGDFSINIKATNQDEIGNMLKAINNMAASLRHVTNDVLTSSERISDFAKELSEITAKTNESIATQLENTHQVAAAITEMAASTQEVASHATGTASATQEANDEADNGSSVVDNNRNAIEQLVTQVDRKSVV